MGQEHRDRHPWGQEIWAESWASWGSPIGLGMFFVLSAVAFELVRFAFR